MAIGFLSHPEEPNAPPRPLYAGRASRAPAREQMEPSGSERRTYNEPPDNAARFTQLNTVRA
ncbi:hypothetical protein GCM10010349_18180 [Streptomyces flavofungini]|nr:hypothetical protein GCM10010349_18180 [Streptomyces flavofungini]